MKGVKNGTATVIKRALIVRKPYARMIVGGVKTWEMRSRPTTIRERIGIIEAGSGLIIGAVDLVDSLNLSLNSLKDKVHKHQVDDFALLEKWHFAWVLERPKLYKEPRVYIHHPGAVVWVKLD